MVDSCQTFLHSYCLHLFGRFILMWPLMLSRFMQKNVVMVCPKGTFVTSSNYKPPIGWMDWAQMVAFNLQVRFKFQCSKKAQFK